MAYGRVVLVGVVLTAGLLGHAARDGTGRAQLAQTTGGSNSNGGNSSSNNSSSGSSNSNSNSSSGSSNSSSNNNGSSGNSNGSSGSNNNSSNNNGGTGGGTQATTGATTPGQAASATTIAPSRVQPARPTSCPDDATSGAQCYRVRVTDDPQGVRLPDGRVVALPPGPTVNVDTGASTSNDIDQVVIINNDNRVVGREPVSSRVRQWVLATIGLLVLVLVAAGAGAAIFRAGLRQGRDK